MLESGARNGNPEPEREPGARNSIVSIYKSEPRRRFPAGVRCRERNPLLSPQPHHVGGLVTPLAPHRLELDDLAFRERPGSFTLDRRVMGEALLAAVFAAQFVSLVPVGPL